MTRTTRATPAEQTRARYPDQEGFVERDGVRTFYEAYGDGERTILLLPTWSLLHSRVWKAQIPYLSRHFRVVTFDGRGNGKSDRPSDPEAYREEEFAADALAVMDATDTEQATLVSLSRGAERSLHIGAGRPERVAGMVAQMSKVAASPAIAIVGAGAALANPGGFIPLALKSISETNPSAAQAIADWIFFAFVALLPLAAALVALLVARRWAERVLQRAREWLERHARTVAAVLLILLAAALIRNGVVGLTS